MVVTAKIGNRTLELFPGQVFEGLGPHDGLVIVVLSIDAANSSLRLYTTHPSRYMLRAAKRLEQHLPSNAGAALRRWAARKRCHYLNGEVETFSFDWLGYQLQTQLRWRGEPSALGGYCPAAWRELDNLEKARST